MAIFEIITGNITKPLGVTTIVNAANNSLLGGGVSMVQSTMQQVQGLRNSQFAEFSYR